MGKLVYPKRESYIMVDHRFSPGLTPDEARACGMPVGLTGEGKLFEGKSRKCPHCGNCVMFNPERTRPRHDCRKCMSYICDFCHAEMQNADYVHKTFEQKSEEILRANAPQSAAVPLITSEQTLGSPQKLLFP
jgi:hypothetical protein